MTEGPDEGAPGRDDIVRRLTRLLAALERARRQPNRREAYHLRDALRHLAAHDYPQGEDAVQRAERSVPLPGHVANLLTTNETVTVGQLREELNGILRNS